MKRILTIPLGVPVLVLIWFFATRGTWISRLVLPAPEDVLRAGLSQVMQSSLWHDVAMTTYRALVGLSFSALLGIPLGLALGHSSALYRHVALPIDVIRSIPAATLFPVFILAFGIGQSAKIAVVFYGCFFMILMAAIYGGRPHPDRQKRIQTLCSLRARPIDILRFVVLPDAMPSILGGLRIATSVAFVLVVITEMFLGGNDGLGKRIYDCYLAYRIPELYSALLVLGAIGYLSNTAIEQIERGYKARLVAQRR